MIQMPRAFEFIHLLYRRNWMTTFYNGWASAGLYYNVHEPAVGRSQLKKDFIEYIGSEPISDTSFLNKSYGQFKGDFRTLHKHSKSINLSSVKMNQSEISLIEQLLGTENDLVKQLSNG